MATVTSISAPTGTSEHLRPFNVQQDLRPVADLVELCFAETLDPDGKRYIQRMRAASENKGFLHWAALNVEIPHMPFTGYVWEVNGKIIGNASLIPYRIKGRQSYLIANVAVHPKHRRKGIARAMTIQAMQYARTKGAKEIWLHVRDDNNHALDLYSSLGFIQKAQRSTWLSKSSTLDQMNISHQMTKALGHEYWNQTRSWVESNYPDNVTWHLPLNISALRPGIRGLVLRVLNNIQLRKWAAVENGKLLAALFWQSSSSHADSLWLAAPVDADDDMVQDLLIHSRRSMGQSRRLRLEFPAGRNVNGIQSASFQLQQTLIWMSHNY